MNILIEKIEFMKTKLISVSKQKLQKEAELARLHNIERSLDEELCLSKSQMNFLREQLEDLKGQIYKTKHQISMIEICKSSEKSKIETHISNLNDHLNGFVELFNRERNQFELRNKGVRSKEAEQIEIERQRQLKVDEINEQQAKQAETVENECAAIEQECAVLKKRNYAIMLKLRRKLVETEDARRDLLKNKEQANSASCKNCW